MGLLVEAVNNKPGLLILLQDSHLPEFQKDLESQLILHFAGITGQGKSHSKDMYSNFLHFFWCSISTPSLLENLVSLFIKK
jgi:hypothetical protein